MNLMKLFHFNYLKQNLKKSRVILAFVLFMLPILNLLIFFMGASSDKINVYDLNKISSLTTFGLFIIPVVISILLFSYVFKKKSIDFMGSMPLNRKTIFITNTVGGIILIITLIGFTTILLGLASLLLSNVYIPRGVFLDYFILYTLSYIFVFVVCNLAISVSGNVPTTLVVTALILFLVPFLNFAYTGTRSSNEQIFYNCENCSTLIKEYSTNLIEVKEEHYTTPAQVLISVFDYENKSLYVDSALGRMALLTILYGLIGFIIFQKKELEICETSFKKDKVHMIVRSLTIIPIMALVYEATRYSNFIALIFAFTLVLVYSFIYDLITRRSVTPIKNNIIAFIITIIVLYPFSGFLLGEYTQTKTTQKVITASQIESITINESDLDVLKNLDGTIKLKDKNIYNLLLARERNIKSENYFLGEVYVTTKTGIYKTTLFLTKEEYIILENIIKNTKAYQDTKNNNLKEYDIITLGHDYVKLEDKDIEIIKKGLESPSFEQSSFYLPIFVYTYKDHVLTKKTYYSNMNSVVNQMAVDRYNYPFKKLLENNKNLTYSWLSVEDEYDYKYYSYFDGDEVREFISAIKNQPTNVEEKLYKINTSLDNGNAYYHYYVNLSEEILNKFKIFKTEVVDIENVD